MKKLILFVVVSVLTAASILAGPKIFTNQRALSPTTGEGHAFVSGDGTFVEFVAADGVTTSWVYDVPSGKYELFESGNRVPGYTTEIGLDGKSFITHGPGGTVLDGGILIPE